MSRRRKPTDPAAHAALMLARKRDAADLVARGVIVTVDDQHRIINARRLDVFALLHERKALTDPQLIAVRRLEVLIGVAFGHEKPDQGERVDTSCEGAPGQNVSQTMIAAMGDLRAIMGNVGPVNAKLLRALLAPTDSPAVLTRWRKTVEDETREKRPDVQAAMVRAACENLALAWREFDYRARERRERAA